MINVLSSLDKRQETTAIGLSRLLKHLQNQYGVISAYRDEYPLSENKKRQAELQKKLRQLGYGFIPLESAWEEDGVVSIEEAVLVPKIDKKDLIKLGQEYEQYAVLYGDSNVARLICTNEDCKQYENSCIGCSYKTLTGVALDKQFKGAFSRLKKGNKNARKTWQLTESYLVEKVNLPVGKAAKRKIRWY